MKDKTEFRPNKARGRFSKWCMTGLIVIVSQSAWAIGIPVGTLIENTATVDFILSGTPTTMVSNTISITVVERIDVVVTLQSPQVLVVPNDTGRALLFTVTNTGNGTETFLLAIDSAIAGDDFDPIPSVPAIYFDTDGSGDFNAGDVAYVPGTNDPVLAADASIDVLLLNDIPGAVVNGNIGRSQLTATSATGSGAAGTEFTGQGDGGVDAIDADAGEFDTSGAATVVVRLGDLTQADGIQTIVFQVTID